MTVRHDGLTVDWLGYATARIAVSGSRPGASGTESRAAADGPVVYTDPGRYGTLDGEWASRYGGVAHPSGAPYDAADADLVVVTHDHHYDSDGVRRVAADDATVLVYESVDADRIDRDVESPEALPYDVRRVSYGDDLSVAGVDVTVVPAYNRTDGPRADADGTVSHPEGFGCGYVLRVDGVPCFWPGDSDAIDEHEGLDVSLFLPSIAEDFTMGIEEAADLAEDLDPDLVLPIHYNTFPGLEADSRAFASEVAARAVPVVLDERTERL